MFGCLAYAKRVGPGISKLSDRSVPGVFLGYEPGTKAYRVFDPIQNKLIISRDVIFNEKKRWNWEEKGSKENSSGGYTFSVYYPEDAVAVGDAVTVEGPTTGGGDLSGLDSGGEEPLSPAPSIPSSGGAAGTSPHTPTFSAAGSNGGSIGGTGIQWATPPTGGLVRYRTIPNLLDTTDEV